MSLPSHEDFEAEIRARHERKSAFWAYVNGTRRDRDRDDDDDDDDDDYDDDEDEDDLTW